nr:DUF6440 family protein [uncultured Butyrivibrio sp.]
MKRLVLLTASIAVLLFGCEKSPEVAEAANVNIPYASPSMNRVMSFKDYHYLVDENTGVVYLEYDSGLYKYGITVMLNADGTPVTAEQLGIEN